MKQKIYILGLATTLTIVLGLLLKLNHYPGAGILTTVGIGTLIFVFLPMALVNHYNNEGEKSNLSLYIVTWLTCLVVFTSMLFKLMHWPGAGYMLIIAIPFPFLVFLPLFLIVTSKNKSHNIQNTVYVLLLLAGVSLFTALLGLNVTKDRIEDSFNITGNYNRVEKALDAVTLKDNSSPLCKSIDELLGVIDGYRNRIYISTGTSKEELENNPEKFTGFASQFKNRAPLKNDKGAPDTRLEDGLRNLMSVLAATPGCETIAKAVPDIFSISSTAEKPGEWSKVVLENGNSAWILIYLDGLETNLKIIRTSFK